ncbi:hypothetical protein [uncultured Gimesia sp.]|uniref:hypothetical protein n=1 Tax=uncultured Gimesia sp. TaxID=1678688 RepID=UPI00261117FC|nr:hypothetical protein [uncultured Gimesia sp.]
MNETRKIDYARRLLQMNPLEQTRDILALRRDFLKPESELGNSINESVSFDDRKEQTIKNIDSLRKGLWTLDSQTLRKQIEAIDISELPDLAVSLSRLKAIADHRESFQKLQEHPDCFPQFYEQFCSLVSASPQRIVKLRAEFLDASRKGAIDPRYRNPREYYRIAKVIRREMPKLYELEKPWLEQIISRRKSENIFGLREALLAILALLLTLCFYLASKQM